MLKIRLYYDEITQQRTLLYLYCFLFEFVGVTISSFVTKAGQKLACLWFYIARLTLHCVLPSLLFIKSNSANANLL